tara:strand:+ start:670 stop:3537 length:2868 start_codon:yes stop_codon:yes gene_type:complete
MFGLSLGLFSLGVDHSKFRTCKQTNFCVRKRTAERGRDYVVGPSSIQLSSTSLTAQLHGGPWGVPLKLELLAYDTGVARMRITEVTPLHGPRWEPDDILLDQTAHLTPLTQLEAAAAPAPIQAAVTSGDARAYSFAAGQVVALQLHPFKLELYQEGQRVAVANGAGKFYFEHHRTRDDNAVPAVAAAADVHGGKTVVDYGEDGLAVYSDGTKQVKGVDAQAVEATTAGAADGLWEERFGAHHDSKPFGPASVGIDIRFEGSHHVYGLAEHSSPLNLPSTVGDGAHYAEPYRLWTLDVYDYELDSPAALYGGVPLMLSHKVGQTAAALWFNPTETFVDVWRDGASAGAADAATSAYFMSESGVVDLMLLPGPTPAQIFGQYAKLTGYTALPPLFSLGYHQCRWSYKDETDVRYVHGQFEALDLPYDVLWLDIDHADGKRYFTWNKDKFPDPIAMQDELAATGRKMVTIVDPHIKKDTGYATYNEGHAKGYFVQTKDGSEYDGWCWPGSSTYLDFTSAEVRDWWASRFNYDTYKGSTPNLYTWNDMNEPSVFNGPEVSMNKDNKNLAGVEHREWHNLYGMYMHRATAEGLVKRNPQQDKRPFVLSRSFYAGSQRWGPIWTGDNACLWSHLEAAMPMLLNLGLCGITFSGADVGGFLGKPTYTAHDHDPELFIRWFQTGAYQPFFRGHAHEHSSRREPWTYGDETTATLREYAKVRYQLLCYWYTLFHLSEATGVPTMRPMWVEFPDDARTFAIEKQYMAGASLLVAPVTTRGATSVSLYFPAGSSWYDVDDGKAYSSGAAGTDATLAAPLVKIPVFQRGGSVLPRQMRLRRSSAQMGGDPYTLVVAPDATGAASGQLYLDEGDGFGYRDSDAYHLRTYTYGAQALTSSAAHAGQGWTPPNTLERVEVLGVAAAPARVSLTHKGATRELSFHMADDRGRLVIRKPDVPMSDEWTITLH